MSLIVFIIAAAPAALVWYIGYKSQSKFKIYLTAVLCACAGLLTGNPIYAALDVILVIAGLVFGLQAQKDQQRRRADAAMRSQLVQAGLRKHTPDTQFVEGTEQGWDERCAQLDAKRAERVAALQARKAEAAAAALAPQVETVLAALTKAAVIEGRIEQKYEVKKRIKCQDNLSDDSGAMEDLIDDACEGWHVRNAKPSCERNANVKSRGRGDAV